MTADLCDALRAGNETNDQRTLGRLKLLWNLNTRHDRNIGRFNSTIGEINAGRSLGRAADSGQDHISRVKVVSMLAVVMKHRKIQCIDAAEVFGIECVLTADLGPRLGIEILREACDYRVKDRDAGHRQLSAAALELAAQILVDDGEENDSGLPLDLAQDALKLPGRAHQRIDMFDRLVVGVMRHCGACNSVERLAGCIGNEVHVKEAAHQGRSVVCGRAVDKIGLLLGRAHSYHFTHLVIHREPQATAMKLIM